MDLEQLLQLLNNRLSVLNNGRVLAFNSGDLDTVNKLDADLLSTHNSITQILLLQSISTAANAANMTPTQMVSDAIESSQNIIQGPSAGAIINGYDISAYATDPLYEQKIQTIVDAIPLVDTPALIDVYIQSTAPESQVTGSMVLSSAAHYGVDVPLLLAIMQNDSNFGTLGIGAKTYNPGNVGNTGSATQTYASWDEGVSAVAQWLNTHRVSVAPVVDPQPVPPVVVADPATPTQTPTTSQTPELVVAPIASSATSTTPLSTEAASTSVATTTEAAQ